MKPTKFRIWNKETNRMIYPERFDGAVWIDENGWAALEHFTGKLETIIDINQDWECLMQFLGMEDQDEVELYEGDIIEILDEVRLIRDIYDFGYQLYECRIFNQEFRIIGNVHQNPELIKKHKLPYEN